MNTITKSFYLFFLLLAMNNFILNAQWINVYNYNNAALYALDCINEDTVLATGYNSTILRTFDKGQTWQLIDPGFDIQSTDINFPDKQTGYIIGTNGRIAKTMDCGDTWELIVTDTNYRLEEVVFIHPDTGWIIANDMLIGYNGGLILRTYTGGEIWNKYYIDDCDLFDIEIITNTIGLIGIKNNIAEPFGFLKTDNGGETWLLSNPEFFKINTVSFINENIGYCTASQSGLYKTIDGGTNWEFITYESNIGFFTRSQLRFLTDDIGFYLGWEYTFDDGKIARTDDEGYYWTDQITEGFWDMDMINIDTGYALTWDGKIYKTINGGIPVGVTESNIAQIKNVTFSPNPLIEKSIIKINPNLLVNYSQLNFMLYDQKGIKVKQIKSIKTSEIEITRGNLSTGMYSYSLTNKNRIIESGKLLIK